MKKYRDKKTGEIVEAKQWTTSSLSNSTLGVVIDCVGSTNWDSNFKCEDCGHSISTHGILNTISSGVDKNTLICPGDYVVKISDEEWHVGIASHFEEVFELLVAESEIINGNAYIGLFETISSKGHLFRTFDIKYVTIVDSYVTIYIGCFSSRRTTFNILFENKNLALAYYKALSSFRGNSYPYNNVFFPKILKRAVCTYR